MTYGTVSFVLFFLLAIASGCTRRPLRFIVFALMGLWGAFVHLWK